ncbi:MAG: aldo/keto reductase [Armatimonadota bacterium]
MLYRTHPSTGLSLSAIGFGGMRFENPDDPDACAELLLAAYHGGINYFDTAIGYGKSEELFGHALKEMKKTRATKPFYISSKTFAGTPDDLRRDIETSLTRMGLDYIDFYHFWCLLSPEIYQQRKPILKEFEKLKEEGLIRHICVSTHMSGADIGEMLRDYPFESVLLGYSAMNFLYREPGLDAAAAQKIGVIVMNPLGGGIIPQHPDRFAFLKSQQEETVVEAALRFLINDTRITTSLVGFSNQAQLQEALRAADGFIPLAEAQLAEIRLAMKGAFNEMCTGCQYCDHCPVELPIPKLMDAYNQYLLSGNTQDIANRLSWHWSLLNDRAYFEQCTECGACEAACTQHLPIIARIKAAADAAEKAKAQQG